jgi:hypothetical protein
VLAFGIVGTTLRLFFRNGNFVRIAGFRHRGNIRLLTKSQKETGTQEIEITF